MVIHLDQYRPGSERYNFIIRIYPPINQHRAIFAYMSVSNGYLTEMVKRMQFIGSLTDSDPEIVALTTKHPHVQLVADDFFDRDLQEARSKLSINAYAKVATLNITPVPLQSAHAVYMFHGVFFELYTTNDQIYTSAKIPALELANLVKL